MSEISKDRYWQFLRAHRDSNYQQTPEWGDARRAQWQPELVGWFDSDSRLTAAAVLRYRRMPAVGTWFVYIPQGPLLDWSGPQVSDQLTALSAYLRARGVFGARITPAVSLRRWDAATVKAGLTDPDLDRLSALEPTEVNPVGTRLVNTLRTCGWREAPQSTEGEDSHPRFNFWLHLSGKSEDAVLEGMTRTWRKNIRKSGRAGVDVTLGSHTDLDDVHRLYEETARRNGFSPQPQSYFDAMWETLGEGFPGHFCLHMARHEGVAVAASATAQVGGRAQGVFAATSTERSQIKSSNAVYWAIIRQAIADGAELFDIGGVDDTLHEQEPAAGLVRFKADMGAEAHEYVGAWDLPLQPRLYAVFTRVLPAYAAVATWLRAVAGPWRPTQ